MVPVTAALLVTGLGSVIARSTGHEETAWVLLAVCICFLGIGGLVIARCWPWPAPLSWAGVGLIGLVVSLLPPAGQRVAIVVMSVAVLGLGVSGIIWGVARR